MSELQQLRDEVGEIKEKLANVAESLAAVRAVTDALDGRRNAEAQAMWGKAGDTDDRLRIVERDYATKADIVAVKNEISDTNRRMLDVEKQVSRMVGWGAAALAIIQLIGIAGMAAVLKFGS